MHGSLQSKIDPLESYLSSSLVSEIISMSIESLICSRRRSNLFLYGFIFKCVNISLFMLSIRIFLREFLKSSGTEKVEASETFSDFPY